MICDQCKLSRICKIHDVIVDPNIVISISSCSYANNSSNMPVISTHDKKLKDFNAVAKSIRALTQDKKEEEKPCEDIKDAVCSSCGKKVTEIIHCSKCGKIICDNCAVYTLSGDVLCPSCYDNANVSIPEKFT